MSFFGNALGGNPFSTPVGSRIEQATDGTLASENWGLNMEICDLINETEDEPRDAVKAIRKRLAQNAGKNYTVVIYTLTVLETCVKNCGKRFHVLVCNKDFVMELVKLIGPKNDPPMAVQEKVLGLIQAWADAFRNQPEMNGVVTVYQDLLDKGIQFPATDLDAMAPIHTPQRSVDKDIPTKTTSDHADLSHSKTHPHQSHSPPTNIISSMISTNNASSASSSPHHPSHPRPDVTHPPGIGILGGAGEGPQAHEEEEEEVGNLTADQRAKLQSELDVVQANMNVLGEMLSEMKPGYEQPDELELLQELHATCLSMQERLVELISKLSNDELTAELLRINDDLNNLFLRYSRWEKNRDPSTTTTTGASGPVTASQKSSSVTSASTILAKAIPQPPSQSLTGTNSSINNNGAKPPLKQNDSLIDFDDDLPEQLSKLSTGTASASAQLSQIQTVTANNAPISSGTGAVTATRPTSHGDDDFDMFAQSRNVTYETSKTSGSTYKDNLEPDQMAGGLSSATQAKQNKREQLPPDLEFDEMASWLGQTTGGEESVTSSEFERFLAERAAAAEQLPNVTGSTNTTNINSNVTTTTTTSSSSRTTKEDQKDKKTEGLFAL